MTKNKSWTFGVYLLCDANLHYKRIKARNGSQAVRKAQKRGIIPDTPLAFHFPLVYFEGRWRELWKYKRLRPAPRRRQRIAEEIKRSIR